MVLSATGLAATATLALALLRRREPLTTLRHAWVALTVAWLLLLWTAALFEVAGGTSAYGATPVTAMRVPVFIVLALSTLVGAGLVPWRSWVPQVLTDCTPDSAALAVAVLVPLSLYPLARAYAIGAGEWPSAALNVAVSAVGAATAIGAAVRAQAAPQAD